MKIVFVHGRDQQGKDALQLRSIWIQALRDGMAGIGHGQMPEPEVAFPYYGDLLFRLSKEEAFESLGLIESRGAAGESAEELEFSSAIVREMAHRKGWTDEDIARRIGADELTEKGIANWEGVLALLRLLDGVEGVTAAFLEMWLQDTWHYLTRSGVRMQVHAVVNECLPEEEDCMVVGHSLGSVIAYNVLMERQRLSNIKCLVTLGSPLGVREIYRRLPSAGGARRAPHGVGSWFNARDPRDTVALHEISPAFFSGDPVVRNYSEVVNRSENRHRIVEYLGDPKVARIIVDVMQSAHLA